MTDTVVPVCDSHVVPELRKKEEEKEKPMPSLKISSEDQNRRLLN
jgi:hypothetical protein